MSYETEAALRVAAYGAEKERDALREALAALLREHDSVPDARGSDAWDAARKLLEGK
ncbi:MAG: hypothetical protein M0Z68_01445 [Gammaproteobacteria bacterium]|jgi:hypothetical protein|nr:hypothetical protein [Gammaproteobacteria bacterium]